MPRQPDSDIGGSSLASTVVVFSTRARMSPDIKEKCRFLGPAYAVVENITKLWLMQWPVKSSISYHLFLYSGGKTTRSCVVVIDNRAHY